MLKLYGAITEGKATGKPGQVVSAGDSGISVCCGDQNTVLVGQVQAQGKKRMLAVEFLRGADLAPGDLLE